MNREIVGFEIDEAGDTVTLLDCGHRRHVRHRPPFELRPWAIDASERQKRLGTEIACGRCEQAELPEGLSFVRRLGPFDAAGLPAGLRRPHRTAPRVWAVVEVVEGEVRLRLGETGEITLAKGERHAIPPGMEHVVSLGRGAIVALELLRVPTSSGGSAESPGGAVGGETPGESAT
ncbi:MAG: DUF3565 domain-containing protein [Acidimicrobiales bacterium]